jgi:hypothetical protein
MPEDNEVSGPPYCQSCRWCYFAGAISMCSHDDVQDFETRNARSEDGDCQPEGVYYEEVYRETRKANAYR